MPLTPEANLQRVSSMQGPSRAGSDVLDKLLGLDIGHAVHTGDTITSVVLSASRFHINCHLGPIQLSHERARHGIHVCAVGVPVQGFPGCCCLFVVVVVVARRQDSPLACAEKRTRQTGRGQSRQGRTPPGRHGFSAREWTRPRSGRPSLRRMCGFGGPRRWVRHFAVGEPVSLAEIRATRQKRMQKPVQLPTKLRMLSQGHARAPKSSIELPGRVQGGLGPHPSTGRWHWGSGPGGRRWCTHCGDSARGREGADGARALSEGVPEHLFEQGVASRVGGGTIAIELQLREGRLRREVDASLQRPT